MSSSDGCGDSGFLSGGLPIYGLVKDSTEAACKKWGMTDGEAKITGTIAGVFASAMTTIFTGQS